MKRVKSQKLIKKNDDDLVRRLLMKLVPDYDDTVEQKVSLEKNFTESKKLQGRQDLSKKHNIFLLQPISHRPNRHFP